LGRASVRLAGRRSFPARERRHGRREAASPRSTAAARVVADALCRASPSDEPPARAPAMRIPAKGGNDRIAKDPIHSGATTASLRATGASNGAGGRQTKAGKRAEPCASRQTRRRPTADWGRDSRRRSDGALGESMLDRTGSK
jgi:hypothetical protein